MPGQASRQHALASDVVGPQCPWPKVDELGAAVRVDQHGRSRL